MLLTNLFESQYGAGAGVETIRQLLHAVKNNQDIDLKVGPELFPIVYSDARYLLQYWKANREGGDATAEYFGNANWIEDKLAKRDYTMSPDRLKDIDQERMKSKDYDRMVGIEEDIPADFIPEPVVTLTLKELEPGMDPMSNDFYDKSYAALLANYVAKATPEVKKKFNMFWNQGWAKQMRELYGRMHGLKEYATEPTSKKVTEGTWALPETEEQVAKLAELMSEPLPVGVNAVDATTALYDIIGDDKLFDTLETIAKDNPTADVRSYIAVWLADNMPDVLDQVVVKDTEQERMLDITEAEFEITYKDPQFDGTRKHTIKAVNRDGAEAKFLGFGNPYTILDIKKAEKVTEASYIDGKEEDPKSLRWKQTSMSYKEASEKYGKDKVRKEGKNRAGQEIVAVHVPLGEGTHERTNESVQVKEETEYQIWWKGEEIDSFASKEEAVAMQKEYTMAYKSGVSIKKAKVKESFFDPREKKIPSPTSDNPVTKRVEEDESPRKMYHKHFVKAMKAMSGSQVQKRHQLEMEKYKKMMGKSFIDQVAPKEFAKFDRKVEEGYPTDYKGWKYDVEYIEDEDTRKKLHSATKDGKQVDIDWSPYSDMSDTQFKTWIDLGMPNRKTVDSIGPLDTKDLEQLMKTKLGTRARLAQEDTDGPMDIELMELKYTDKEIAKAITIARGSDGDMTGATDTIEAIADGLSNHPDVEKVLKIANEAKDDDITKKLDPKTKLALKKAQMKSAGLTKGDPIASLAFGLEKDVDRLGKENDKEEADIAGQELVDKYHSQELNTLKKSLAVLLKK